MVSTFFFDEGHLFEMFYIIFLMSGCFSRHSDESPAGNLKFSNLAIVFSAGGGRGGAAISSLHRGYRIFLNARFNGISDLLIKCLREVFSMRI